MKVEVLQADYHNTRHAGDIPGLLDAYARDPMGGAQPLADEVKQSLVSELARRPQAFSVIAYVDAQPAGLVNCFECFSTFECKPLVNIHDVVVLQSFRGQGLAARMLDKVEAIARQRGCCKLTLEVLSGNSVAQSVYRKFGFSDYQLDPQTGSALFWHKSLLGDR